MRDDTAIPDIFQFWGTTALFRPVKGAPKSASICNKKAKTGQNLAFSMLKRVTGLKYTTAGGGGGD